MRAKSIKTRMQSVRQVTLHFGTNQPILEPASTSAFAATLSALLAWRRSAAFTILSIQPSILRRSVAVSYLAGFGIYT